MGVQRGVRTRNVAGPRLWVKTRYHNVVVMASKKIIVGKNNFRRLKISGCQVVFDKVLEKNTDIAPKLR